MICLIMSPSQDVPLCHYATMQKLLCSIEILIVNLGALTQYYCALHTRAHVHTAPTQLLGHRADGDPHPRKKVACKDSRARLYLPLRVRPGTVMR